MKSLISVPVFLLLCISFLLGFENAHATQLISIDAPVNYELVVQGEEEEQGEDEKKVEEEQDDEKKDDEKKEKTDDKKDKKKKDVKDSEIERIENIKQQNPKEIRMHLWDGNVIAGDLSVAAINIKTEFGLLSVPVEKIQSIRPGLESFPKKKAEIEKLIADLGSNDYKTREAAHKAIVRMGMELRNEIPRFEDGGNAERKRHLAEIRKEIDQLVEEMMDDDGGGSEEPALILGDAIQTKDFVIVGKIQEKGFEINSKYGKLAIQLEDIKMGDRQVEGSTEIRRTVSVIGKNFMGSNTKNSGIRVSKGDRITVRAEGQIVMSPWGSRNSVGPNGNTSYGNYNGHGGGTLLAKIGDSGKQIKIGTKASFTASRSGVLKFGIAVQNDYATNDYAYPGSYKVKITVISNQ